MNCKEVRPILMNYLANEVTPSQKRLIQAHLAECRGCADELAELSALQSRISASLHSQAAQAEPSPQALIRLQARLALEAPRNRPAMHEAWLTKVQDGLRNGVNTMKKPAFAAVAVLVVLVATAAFVPGVRAQVQNVIDEWLRFDFHSPNSENIFGLGTNWGFAPFAPTYMPDDLELNGSMIGGEDRVDTLGLCYQSYDEPAGYPFVVVYQTTTDGTASLPKGKLVKIRGENAVLDTTAGELEWCLYPHSYVDPSHPVGELLNVEEHDPNDIAKPVHTPLVYEDANRLTMLKDGVKVEIFGSYSEKELIRIAKSLEEAPPSEE